MIRTMYEPLAGEVVPDQRKNAQDDFGRHVIEQRNRMAVLVRQWIETDKRFPVPVYDRLLDRVRPMDAQIRAEVASIALLMADQIVTAVLTAFDKGDDMTADGMFVNYAIIAQKRKPGSDEVFEEVDVNRGEPVLAVWKAYGRWLNRFAPADLRASCSRGEPPKES